MFQWNRHSGARGKCQTTQLLCAAIFIHKFRQSQLKSTDLCRGCQTYPGCGYSAQWWLFLLYEGLILFYMVTEVYRQDKSKEMRLSYFIRITTPTFVSKFKCFIWSMAFELELVWICGESIPVCTVAAVKLQGWCAGHSHERWDYDQGWACLSLAVLAWLRGELGIVWPTKWIWCRMWGNILPTHASHLLSLTDQRGSRLPCISHTSKSQQGRCAACYLTWLSGSSSAHYCTQTHSPVMIYCLAAYGITLELSGQTAARCFMEENSD